MPEFCYDCSFREFCDPENNDFMVSQCEDSDFRDFMHNSLPLKEADPE